MIPGKESNRSAAFYEALSCNLMAPGHGAIRFVQLFFMPGIFLVVVVLGLPLNIFSLWVFSRRLSQRKRSTVFLHNLALADTSWLLALPFLIQFHLSGMDWSLGPLFCKLMHMYYHSYFYLSIFFVTCVSVDRYLAIVHPLRSPVLLTHQRAIVLCIAVWVASIVISVPVASLTYTSKCESNKTVCIMYIFSSIHMAQCLLYSLCCTCIAFLFPLIVLTYCYVCSVLNLRRRDDPRLRALACELSAAMVLFGLFYLPYHVSRNIAIAIPALAPDNPSAWGVAYMVFCLEMCMCSLTSCTNPLFSCFVGRTLRKELWLSFILMWKKQRVDPETVPNEEESGMGTINEAASSISAPNAMKCSCTTSCSHRVECSN